MKIGIVGGFFLPLPAVAGGATEKTWTRLASFFADQGHEVTVISRRWPNLDPQTQDPSVKYKRLSGFDHSGSLMVNLCKDFWWSLKVTFSLPRQDILIVNAVFLPVWVRLLRPSSGKLVIMTGRVPKGQYRLYRHVSLAVAASTPVLDMVKKENRQLGEVGRVYGYPIDFRALNGPAKGRKNGPSAGLVRIGFVGRIHREKGIDQLVEALHRLSERDDLPPWSISICGPVEVSQGGSGKSYLEAQVKKLGRVMPPARIELLAPKFDAADLAKVYQSLDVFVLPSLSERGETFGVAAVEAMAAGCAVVTSRLRCFRDFLAPEDSGLVYDHRSPEAAVLLADALERLVRDDGLRTRLALRGAQIAQNYDFEVFGQRLLADFDRITPKS